MKLLKFKFFLKASLLMNLLSNATFAEEANDLPGLSAGNLSSGADALLFNAGNEKKTAYVRLAMPNKEIRGGELKWDIAIETPYDDTGESGPSIFADFDGVANSTNVQFNVAYWNIDKRSQADQNLIDQEGEGLCRIFLGINDYSGNCVDSDFTKEIYCRVVGISDCDNEPDSKFEAYKALFAKTWEAKRRQLELGGELKPITGNIFGFKSKIGRENFKFKDATAFADQEQTESPWSITAYYYRKSGRTVWGGGLEYQESYTGSSETQICSPVPVPENATSCSNVVIGEPTQTRRKMAYVELRWANPKMNFAIAPKVTWDFENGETGILLPLYLMRDDKDALTGGISIGWQSETDDVTASIFVGKAFEFF